jgi:hypothetical protein
MPRKLIFIDSQSSVLPGFVANFRVLKHWDRNDRMPMFIAHSTFHLGIIKVTVSLRLKKINLEGINAKLARTEA